MESGRRAILKEMCRRKGTSCRKKGACMCQKNQDDICAIKDLLHFEMYCMCHTHMIKGQGFHCIRADAILVFLTTLYLYMWYEPSIEI